MLMGVLNFEGRKFGWAVGVSCASTADKAELISPLHERTKVRPCKIDSEVRARRRPRRWFKTEDLGSISLPSGRFAAQPVPGVHSEYCEGKDSPLFFGCPQEMDLILHPAAARCGSVNVPIHGPPGPQLGRHPCSLPVELRRASGLERFDTGFCLVLFWTQR